jgi:catechol 2,3-dioxygenase-like lactoylglutathione lyase family enzyme
MTDPSPARPVLELRVALTTAEYDRLVKFYVDALGLEPAQLWTGEQTRAMILELGRGTLELFNEAHAELVDQIETERRTSGRIRFALQVPDLQAAIDRLLDKGASLVHTPVLTPWGDYNVRVEDPDGMQVTLFQSMGKHEAGS